MGMFEENTEDNGNDNIIKKPFIKMIEEYFETIITKEKSKNKIVKGLDNMVVL